MASGNLGANPEQLRTLRAALQREAETTDNLMQSIRAQLGTTEWMGPRAERFRAMWQDEFEPSLRGLQNALVEAGQEVERQRIDLERVTG